MTRLFEGERQHFFMLKRSLPASRIYDALNSDSSRQIIQTIPISYFKSKIILTLLRYIFPIFWKYIWYHIRISKYSGEFLIFCLNLHASECIYILMANDAILVSLKNIDGNTSIYDRDIQSYWICLHTISWQNEPATGEIYSRNYSACKMLKYLRLWLNCQAVRY